MPLKRSKLTCNDTLYPETEIAPCGGYSAYIHAQEFIYDTLGKRLISVIER